MIWLVALLAAHAGPNEQAKVAIRSNSGWEELDTVNRGGVDNIRVRHQKVGEVDCLEASTVSQLPAETMKAVVLDIRGNAQWSSADIKSSTVLSEGGGKIDYVQVLGMPSPFSDRYWFLSGQVSGHDGWTFAWEPLDAAQAYPDALASLKAADSSAVEVNVNVGSWSMVPDDAGTLVRFRSCTNAGGSVPQWAGERAARAMLPNNIVDLINATNKRL